MCVSVSRPAPTSRARSCDARRAQAPRRAGRRRRRRRADVRVRGRLLREFRGEISRGAPWHVLYLLLFAATLALVPLFSLFELSAIVASPLFAAAGAPRRGGGLRRPVSPRRAPDALGGLGVLLGLHDRLGREVRQEGGGKPRRRGEAGW